jgi:hypothetical protein
MKRLFSFEPEARKRGEVAGETLVERWLRQHRTLAQRPT